MLHEEFNVKLIFVKGGERVVFDLKSTSSPIIPEVGQEIVVNDASVPPAKTLTGEISSVALQITQGKTALGYIYEFTLA